MTSSLVGSEMCIRDSLMGLLPSPLHVVRSRGRACGVRGSLPRRGRPESPVSYTHLTLPTICSV
eukprot:583709-Prorocentrum_lima.AAC.1